MTQVRCGGGGVSTSIARVVYIYTLTDPFTNEVRYVGKTVNPRLRIRGHICESRLRHQSPAKAEWIKGLLKRGSRPVLSVIETVSESEWEYSEIRAIAAYRSAGCSLLNRTNGGEGGPVGLHPSAETRAKMSASRRGRIYSIELRRKMSLAQRGLKKKSPSQEMKDAMSDLHPYKNKKLCKFGHIFDETNTYYVTRRENGRQQRKCRTCRMLAQRAYLRRRMAK